MQSTTFGVLVAVSAACCGAFGDTLCRFSYARDQHRIRPENGISKLWVAGITMCTVVENFLTIFSLNYASAALVTPISALHLTLNAALSKIFLQENLIGLHYLGLAMVLGGLILTLAVGADQSPVYSIAQLLQMYTHASFLVFATLCLFSVGLFGYVSFGKSEERETTEIVPGRTRVRGGGGSAEDQMGSGELTTDQNATGASRLRSVLPRRIVTIRHVTFPWGFRRFAIAAMSGIFGGNACVLMEGIIRATSSSGGGIFATFQWQSVILFLFLVALVMGQLFCLNRGIENFEGLKTVPQANAVLIAVSCLASLNLFSSLAPTNSLKMLAFVTGQGCVIWGVLVLSQADTTREIRELQALELTLGNAGYGTSHSDLSSISSDTDEEADRYVESLEIESQRKRESRQPSSTRNEPEPTQYGRDLQSGAPPVISTGLRQSE